MRQRESLLWGVRKNLERQEEERIYNKKITSSLNKMPPHNNGMDYRIKKEHRYRLKQMKKSRQRKARGTPEVWNKKRGEKEREREMKEKVKEHNNNKREFL